MENKNKFKQSIKKFIHFNGATICDMPIKKPKHLKRKEIKILGSLDKELWYQKC